MKRNRKIIRNKDKGRQRDLSRRLLYLRNPYVQIFLISFLILLSYSIIQGISPFGEATFLRKDLYHQYLPFLYELRRRLVEGTGLGYSFDLGLGSSFYALYVYYLSDPLNLLSVFVPENGLLEFLTVITYIKMVIASFSMFRYLTYRNPSADRRYAVVLSLCYGFSGYVAAYDWNVMWMWGIALAPLALLYFEKTVRGEREGRPEIFYILIMAAVTWTNYYIAMLIDIFLVLYFFAVAAENYKGIKETLLSLIRFGVSSVLAAGLAAVLLIPEWAVIRGTSFSGNSLPDHIEFYMQLPTLILRSFPAVGIETGLGHEPGTYATVAVIMLLPLFFMNGRIRPVNKITRGLLILFFYFSFNTNILEFIWHGFNYPDSIPARQTFLLIILLISAGYEALEGMEDTGAVKAGIAVLFTALLYAVCLIFCRDDSHADIYTWILGAVFTALYAVIMILFVFFRTEYVKWGIYCFMMIVVFELAINLNITSPRDVSREGYFTDVMSYRKLAREAEKDDPLNLGCFTRFDTVDENIRNISCLSGYHDASYFSSTIDNGAEDFYKDFGMKASKVHYMGEGLTPFTSAIMGIGYVLADEYRNNQTDYDIATYIGEEGDDYLYKCLFALPFGYTVPEGYYGFDDDDRGVAAPLDRQNKTAIKLGGDEIFHPVDSIYIEEDYGKAVITVPEDGHYYAWTEDDIDTIKEYTDFSEDEYGRFEDLRYDSIMDLGRLEKGGTVTLYTDEESEVEHLDIVLYRFEPNAMRALCEELSSGSFTLTGFKDDRIEALADIPSGRELVLAVPLSVGWTISLDGEQMMTPDEFYGLFIKLDIPEGIHHIELEYNIPLFGIGMTVSVVSLIIILLYILYPKIQVIMHR